MLHRPTVATLVSIALSIAPMHARADANDKAACADAYHGAQTHRKVGALKSAREELLFCASDRCPAILQPDCTRWLGEVEAALPSLAFAAKDEAGEDLIDVRVVLDGEVLLERLDGKAVVVDPGTHVVRFERKGSEPIEQTVVAREGEKARVVGVRWSASAAAKEPETVAPAAPPVNVASPSRTPAWILAGVGVAGLATFGTLSTLGLVKRAELRESCFGSCDPAEIDAVRRQFLIADVALGVGLVSLGVSAWLFTSKPSAEPAPKAVSRISLGVSPSRSGGMAVLSGAF